jgi:hypothetical protein
LAPLIHADAPPVYDGNADFGFVSYKRADLGRIAPFLRRLQAGGMNLWYDRGIPGGSEWNALLEARLDACRAVLFFVTQAAVDSRFVRRELVYADGLGKPIIGIQLEPVHLRGGAGLLMSSLQMLNGEQPDVVDSVLRAMPALR